MKRRAERQTRHRRVQLQMVVLLLLFTLLTTLLTGWIIYDRTSEQVIRDTWQQQEALLRSACSAVNREIEQMKSFSWQMSNDNDVQRYLHLTEQTPKDILTKRGIIEKLQQMKAFSNTMADIGFYAEGLLDQEYLTRDKTSWYSAWTNNQVFMSYDWSAYIDNVANLFKDVETDINIVGAVPPEGPTGISETRDQLQLITVDEDWNAGIYIGASDEQKKAALKLLDYVYSEEGMILMNFGEEGTHFNVVDGDYKYSDLIMNNPDGLSPQDALRQYGIQSMLTLLQDARYERAFVSDEVNRIRDIYEQEGHIGDAFPTLAFTDEEQGVINEKYTEIETYMNETIDKFIMGTEPLDKFDEYVAKVESMGLADVLAVYQAAYDRYMK